MKTKLYFKKSHVHTPRKASRKAVKRRAMKEASKTLDWK